MFVGLLLSLRLLNVNEKANNCFEHTNLKTVSNGCGGCSLNIFYGIQNGIFNLFF